MFLTVFAGSQNLDEGFYFCTDSAVTLLLSQNALLHLPVSFLSPVPDLNSREQDSSTSSWLTRGTDTMCSAMESLSVHFRIFSITWLLASSSPHPQLWQYLTKVSSDVHWGEGAKSPRGENFHARSSQVSFHTGHSINPWRLRDWWQQNAYDGLVYKLQKNQANFF